MTGPTDDLVADGAVLAATVVLLRDQAGGIETLMLRRRSKIAFGGMWVFPGGRIDDGDRVPGSGPLDVARAAAAREAAEESGLTVAPANLVYFAFWVPPPATHRRFATWFFAARAAPGPVVVDGGEITDHEWMRPRDALRRCDAGELRLAAPTWVTLHTAGRYHDVDTALHELGRRPPRRYETRMAENDQGMVAMWAGDAGYETGDPTAPGPRHRLEMTSTGYRFDEAGYRKPG
jgi:8-oxo-dGTP pyrophosphatase MutT (NUDIX family)